jgi:hypothetical protein
MPCHVALERAEQRTKQARPGSKMSYLHASYRYNLPVLVLDVIILVPCSPIQLPEPNRLELSAATGAGVVRYARPSVLCCAVLCMYVCMYVCTIRGSQSEKPFECMPAISRRWNFFPFLSPVSVSELSALVGFVQKTSNLEPRSKFFPFLASHPTPPSPFSSGNRLPPSTPVQLQLQLQLSLVPSSRPVPNLSGSLPASRVLLFSF